MPAGSQFGLAPCHRNRRVFGRRRFFTLGYLPNPRNLLGILLGHDQLDCEHENAHSTLDQICAAPDVADFVLAPTPELEVSPWMFSSASACWRCFCSSSCCCFSNRASNGFFHASGSISRSPNRNRYLFPAPSMPRPQPDLGDWYTNSATILFPSRH